MNEFINYIKGSIDLYIVVIVLCSGFFQNRYFEGFKLYKNDDSYDSALKTLALSALASTIYIVLARNPAVVTNWGKYFISYFAATSLYELLIERFVDWIKSRTGVDIKGSDPKP